MKAPLASLAIALLASLSVAQQPLDRIYLHTLDTTQNLWVFESCCDTSIPTDPKLVHIEARASCATHKPDEVHVDRDGNIWVLDSTNNCVSKWLPPPNSSATQLIWRTPLTGYTGPSNLIFDGNGDAWITVNTTAAPGGDVLSISPNGTLGQPLPRTKSFGVPSAVLPHSNGNVYLGLTNGNVTQLRKLGASWIETSYTTSWGYPIRRMTEGPNGNVWLLTTTQGTITGIAEVALDGKWVASVDCQAPNFDARYYAAYSTQLLLFPLPTGDIEIWTNWGWNAGSLYCGLARFFKRGASITYNAIVSRHANLGSASGGRPAMLVMDGAGRIWGLDPDGSIYWTPPTRPGSGSINMSQRFDISSLVPGNVSRGDLTGMIRAATVDRGRDDDGDTFTNAMEIANNSNPFDKNSTPSNKINSLVTVTTPVAINSAATLTLTGEPGRWPFLFLGPKIDPGQKLPPIVGELLVVPAFFLFQPIANLGRIPPQGYMNVMTGIPNDPALKNTSIFFQAFTLGTTVSDLSNRAEMKIQ